MVNSVYKVLLTRRRIGFCFLTRSSLLRGRIQVHQLQEKWNENKNDCAALGDLFRSIIRCMNVNMNLWLHWLPTSDLTTSYLPTLNVSCVDDMKILIKTGSRWIVSFDHEVHEWKPRFVYLNIFCGVVWHYMMGGVSSNHLGIKISRIQQTIPSRATIRRKSENQNLPESRSKRTLVRTELVRLWL